MAGQGAERREVLRVMSMATAAAAFGGFERWAFAGQAGRPGDAKYRPQFFSPDEYAAIERLTDLIIPADSDSPGAAAAGVSEFIDFMAAHDPEIQYPFRTGLVWLEAHSRDVHGRRFLELAPEQQTGILETLAYAKHARPGEEDGRAFFKLARSYTVMGFYTSRIGMQALQYPGLRFYSASPACPHTNDPEHRHLPPPVV